jgi:hypothetical protein
VFATWSDSEVSYDNLIRTGAVDLKVNGADDEPWGTGVPTKVTIECMIPGKLYGPYEVELWNAGICEFPSHAFIHVKNIVCSNALPKVNSYPEGGSECWYNKYGPDATTGYADNSTGFPYSGDLKPEPELVAEYGGKVDCTWVPGVGVDGDDCSMGAGVRMTITNSEDPTDILRNEDGYMFVDLLGKWECQELWLFDLMPCVPRTIYLWFYLEQDSEDEFFPAGELGLKPGDPGYDAALLHWKKFNDWPSWRYMRDQATFEMEFDLWLEDP